MKDREINMALNSVLVSLFNDIMHIEEKAIITKEYEDISNNDMHIIDAIGINKPQMVSEVARKMSVTQGTVNVAMNALERKGYINRNRSEEDRRVVLVSLTEKGVKAYHHHRDFHKNMMRAIVRDLNDEEKKALHHCLVHLEDFFRDLEEKNRREAGKE
ncbi:MAG: MarR family transcriptional regulator [Lachnospiraceae bacterium]|nr:MarR family transcriptional regulator [Lachnospiraceae bacterium]